ncbi:MAG: gliding motility protein GldL [Chitinophagales bacterium]|nr:gliding motility protein GldL [Chitinophagales bacterium]MDW8419207.1 gliding motility protein GldL [Chitinophagales bacterium]
MASSFSKHPLASQRARTILNYAYSLGAAVVIAGALFKIMHWKGADIMLILGMGTEVIIFIISAFEPQQALHADYEWERVYPELAEDFPAAKNQKPLTQQLDKMLSEAKVGPELINSLGKGFTSLSESLTKLNDLTEATVAANDFSKNAKNAASQISSFAQAAASATAAVNQIGSGAEYTKTYHEQVQAMVKNLSQLNAIYELELQDSNNHLKAMNKFFGNLNAAAQALSDTANDAIKYKDNLIALNKNLTSLNQVYGNMLSAMKAV